MTQYYSSELAPRGLVPVGQVDGSVVGGHVRIRRSTVLMINPGYQIADTIIVAIADIGETFLYGMLNANVTMGAAATIAIETAATAGKYRAAAIFTAAVPTLFGVCSATGIAKLTAVETVIATVAVAALPTAGALIVDTYWAQT